MENTKIKLKVGVHEFEAEGPAEVVSEHFKNWKELISSVAGVSAERVNTGSPVQLSQQPQVAVAAAELAQYQRAFTADEKNGIVSLRVHPTTDDRDADAVLLLMLAYKAMRNEEEVVVTKLMESLRVSGIQPGRLDRAVAPHVRAGFLLKSGRAKGGKYRLSNTGAAQGNKLLGDLVAQMA